MQLRALADGSMPRRTGLFAHLASATKAAVGSVPGTLRLLFVAEHVGCGTPPLSGADLCDLRAFTGARVVYALTAAKVAGAVAQTHVFDYRIASGKGHSHFGAPLGSVEIKLVDMGEHKTTDESPRGEVSSLLIRSMILS
jgi:hypothetical protein